MPSETSSVSTTPGDKQADTETMRRLRRLRRHTTLQSGSLSTVAKYGDSLVTD